MFNFFRRKCECNDYKARILRLEEQIFNLGGEIGVAKWLGLGVQLKFDSYLHNSNVSQAGGFEGGLIVNAHIVRHLHFDLLAGLDLGGSGITLTSNDGTNTQIYGNGSWCTKNIFKCNRKKPQNSC